MSIAMPHRVGSTAFALLVRLFAGLKRKGRVIDVIWFQQDADYARAMLALADNTEDDAVREIAVSLRELLKDYLALPPAEEPAPEPVYDVAPVASPVSPAPEMDRYVGRLR